MKYKNKYYKRICYVGTIYTLLIYLLYSTIEDIKNTLFIFAYGIPDEIMNKFPHHIDLNEKKWKDFISRRAYGERREWILGLIVKARLPRIEKTDKLFAQDHLTFSSQIIGNRCYTFIEDSQLICSKINATDHNPFKKYHLTEKWYYPIIQLLYGKTKYKWFANNNQCKELLVTKIDQTDYLKDKKQILIDITEEWRKAGQEKKDYILNVYDFNYQDIDLLNSKKIILFTQPLGLGENYQIEIFKRIISQYERNNIIIKIHPRDTTKYERYFPEIAIYRKRIPSQLLDLIGIRFEKAVTLFSSAVDEFTYPIDIDWYGTDFDERLKEKWGTIACPPNVTECSPNLEKG